MKKSSRLREVRNKLRHAPKNIVQHELIGLPVEIIDSATESYIGLKGKIVDETYNTLIIETPHGEKKILKSVAKFLFTLPNGKKVVIEGLKIIGRPEERLKKRIKGK